MKIIIFLFISYFSFFSYSFSDNQIDCNQFDKISAKYIECKAKILKEATKKKSENLKKTAKEKTDKLKKSGLAGFFAAALELSREGLLNIMQKESFDKILIKERK